jgi:hypothetical protein
MLDANASEHITALILRSSRNNDEDFITLLHRSKT